MYHDGLALTADSRALKKVFAFAFPVCIIADVQAYRGWHQGRSFRELEAGILLWESICGAE